MAFNLEINDLTESIDEGSSSQLTGTITGLSAPGGEVTLEVDYGDLSAEPSQTQTFTLRDDGTNGDSVAGDGIIEFDLSLLYADDNPTATSTDDYTINVSARENVVTGTDAVFVIDVSGSTFSSAGFDVDGDGIISTFSSNDSILDAQVAAFKALNQDLISRGLGDTAKVSVSAYGSSASLLDLNPVLPGVQTFTTPNADADNNGILDVDQALDTLNSGGGTNFEAGLQQAIAAINAAGTAPGAGSVIFLSDGQASTFFIPDEVDAIRNTLGQNLRAFGVGSGSNLTTLQVIDPNAERFTDIQDLLDLFQGTGSNVNQDAQTTTVTVDNVAPTVSLDSPSDINENETATLNGSFQDPGSLDTFEVEIAWGDGTADSTFDLPAYGVSGGVAAGQTYNSTTDGAVMTITSVDTTTGEVGFSVDHPYTDDGSYSIAVSVSDDDSTVADTATVGVTVLDTTTPPAVPVIPNPEFDPLNAVSVTGTNGNDGLTGTAASELLEGFGGNDVLSGGAGDDFLDGGAGIDTAVYQFDPTGVTVTLQAVDSPVGLAIDGYGDTDTLTSIENVIGSAFDDVIAGDDGVNNLSGGDGDDVLIGNGGSDFLVGGAGADELFGGADADTYLYVSPTEGGDTIVNFETGIDRIMIVGAVFAPGLSGGFASNDQVSLDSSGNLFFDADGTGGSAAQLLANVGSASVSNMDVLII